MKIYLKIVLLSVLMILSMGCYAASVDEDDAYDAAFDAAFDDDLRQHLMTSRLSVFMMIIRFGLKIHSLNYGMMYKLQSDLVRGD